MKPVVILSNPQEQCVTLFWSEQPAYYLGYRFLEHQPERLDSPSHFQESISILTGEFPAAASSPTGRHWPAHTLWSTAFSPTDAGDPTQLHFQGYADGSAWCSFREPGGQQQRQMFFQPVEDGVSLWMKLTTRVPISGVFAVQTCLRMTGRLNAAWRREIAFFPLLSELEMQACGRPNATLTWARQNGSWFNFPVPYTACRTPGGRSHTAGEQALQVDHGLIVRESPHRQQAPVNYWEQVAPATSWQQVSAGLFWERTAAISNRHPADCVHAVVDFGPLEAGQSRILRGKIYFLEGSKDDVLAAWQRDFPSNHPQAG